MRSKSVLVVEDDDNSAELLSTFARSEGFVATVANSLAEARQQLIVHKPGIVLLDPGLPDGSGMDLFSDENLRGDAEIVLITGNASVETSVQALRLGAADYLIKPVSLKLLRTVLNRLADAAPRPAPAAAGVPTEVGRGEGPRSGRKGDAGPPAAAGKTADAFGGMWGVSQGMRDVFTQIERVARTSVSVFIVGESGTGKELVAQSIHRFSHRRNGPFEAVNCGAISAQLIESELFGHEKGSFTGAIKQHKGFFERASGGTLFLDEITEMSLDLQVKLLRVLETGTFSRVGSDAALHSDVRVVAATNRQPIAAVREGKLREDLYYRLNVFQIGLPPLRDRLEDLPLLARHFLASYAKREGRKLSITDAALERMKSYHWPGNVRELRNFIHRTAIMVDDRAIDVDSLPPFEVQSTVGSGSVAERYPQGGPQASTVASDAPPPEATRPAAASAEAAARPDANEMPLVQVRVGSTIADAERDLIIATLAYCDGAKERTADMLGISLKTLYNRLRAYGSD
ncbi:MAG: sigma-54-dependent Fis family transcriptional regulator [Burkholderiaceae bacterium]|nr:sigma-54-dependent Fis family transcriptional regulator [Burkholderiaceae bacterium]